MAASGPPHLLVTQLRFARSEFARGLAGVAAAARQMLGHRELPDFVGDMSQVPYRPER